MERRELLKMIAALTGGVFIGGVGVALAIEPPVQRAERLDALACESRVVRRGLRDELPGERDEGRLDRPRGPVGTVGHRSAGEHV